jgi:DNA-binding transcriptional ArsR family regulator
MTSIRGTVPDISGVCTVLADESRATMAWAMLDGRAWTISELAGVAGIARSTATEHAHRLVDVGLCSEVKQGRHRYLRLRDAQVAVLLEGLGTISAPPQTKASTWRSVSRDRALRAGRTCYQHLAGALGLAIADALRDLDVITPDWQLGAAGSTWFAELDISFAESSRRPLIRPCLDWTERRDHLAGRLGDALCATLIDRDWIRKRTGSRAVSVTETGLRELATRGLEHHLQEAGFATTHNRGDGHSRSVVTPSRAPRISTRQSAAIHNDW